MIGISLKGRKINNENRNKTKLTDVLNRIGKLKWNWADHWVRYLEQRSQKRLGMQYIALETSHNDIALETSHNENGV